MNKAIWIKGRTTLATNDYTDAEAKWAFGQSVIRYYTFLKGKVSILPTFQRR